MDDENDLDNIFKEYEIDDVRESENEPRNDENSANTETNEGETRQVVPVPKRVIRNPRLKFNAERLCGERGIPVLTKHFKNVKFKGKGHEKEDLNKLLSTLEHWSHRLFPSMKFEACLKQIEKLGKKRPVQTCLVKIRRNMPILKDDFVHDEEEEEQGSSMPTAGTEEVKEGAPAEDAFDRLFGEMQDTDGPATVTSTPMTKPTSGNVLGSSFGSSLTEEQRKKIEYNKMLATERRRAKMAATSAMAPDNFGTQSLGVSDSSFDASSKTSSQTHLEQQFDSLFDEPTTQKTNESHTESNQPAEKDVLMDEEDYDETLKLHSDVNKQFDSLFGKPTSQKVNESHSESNQPANEDVSMDKKDYDETLKLPLNVKFDSLFEKPNKEASSSKKCEDINKDLENNAPTEEDCSMDLQDDDDETLKIASSINKESVLDSPSQKSLTLEKKDYTENRCETSERNEMKIQGANEPVENNYKSSDDIFGSMNQNEENEAQLEENHAQLEENHAQFQENHAQLEENHAQLEENHVQLQENEESMQTFCESVEGGIVKELPENNKDSEVNSEEPVNDTAESLLSQGQPKPNESEKEELELDALMDLVGEDFSD